MAALICIDMQNDFCLETSPLCVKGAMSCLPHVKEALATARKHHMSIFWVIREHDPSGVDIEWTRKHLCQSGGAGATLPGTTGAALVDGLEARPGEVVIIKKRFSAFSHTHLDLVLRRLNVRTVAICGVQTPNCIRATAVDALGLDYEVVVLSDATASKSEAVQENNLEDMRCMGIKTPTTHGWAQALMP
uniref:Isochorismatase-like domain-containing protein n=1 Tax=Chlamydomonas leiostraca TaxID=1034604 RepID=A0A7S0WSL0_9CHLO|mmetsp:Transcript_25531/g.64786  ORF Transcript_25531/g.64786 Transcript_25531/m.64786 type:complete len:190 (+) Transcript_25531:97-666(+)|eukprot:CAMPEP_0202866610 /NCGR_PEP_ID=MMETSP1391-20130828/8153_1 /ASSEMBLY_ACC=CAM_ASM_000867 /TAXON_ID=1034604 /ORGANISM="Chlamydomonas leiostraca, Strain SAG 11-49" /LENGTH=189 /DNA_ID=CAMNT_0049546577 /DNA_START=97 /DNA_END=666 /DNA_ORIENTATION=-